ncbi:MAG: hypothetical protein NTY30_01190 [Candidatus Berkelbacteria bacterium]|nr:hypothetical protein [Candidatus Berkelbacteria bacterium]
MSPEQIKLAGNRDRVSAVNSPALNFNSSQQSSLEYALKTIFPESKTETQLQKARRILGDIATDMSDDELIGCLAQFQFLLNSWLDDYEKQIFNEKPLDQLLKGG